MAGRGRTEIYQTTLLDLILGIDEFSSSEQESLDTAIRLLRGGNVKLISNSGELSGSTLLTRHRLRDLVEETLG